MEIKPHCTEGSAKSTCPPPFRRGTPGQDTWMGVGSGVPVWRGAGGKRWLRLGGETCANGLCVAVGPRGLGELILIAAIFRQTNQGTTHVRCPTGGEGREWSEGSGPPDNKFV